MNQEDLERLPERDLRIMAMLGLIPNRNDNQVEARPQGRPRRRVQQRVQQEPMDIDDDDRMDIDSPRKSKSPKRKRVVRKSKSPKKKRVVRKSKSPKKKRVVRKSKSPKKRRVKKY